LRLNDIAKLIDNEVSTTDLMTNIEAIQSIDRQFTFPAFMESAKFVTEKLKGYGCQSRVLRQPADGKTRMGDWTMPMAWDCNEATLDVVVGSGKPKRLCTRSEDPNSLVMWSAPTSPEEVVAEVVGPIRLKRENGAVAALIGPEGSQRPLTPGELTGKVAFVVTDPRQIKSVLVEQKVAGAITCFNPYAERLPHNRAWINGWCDTPGGWAFTAKDTPMWCFMLTPAQGIELETQLNAGKVTATAKVDSRLYEGVLPAATGVFPGKSNEEILTLGHQFEIGADDSASGCAVMLEAARILSKLIGEGKLPAPQRSMRWLFMSECYGSMAYCTMNRAQVKRTLAGMNIDCVGGDQRKTQMPLPISLSPQGNPSVGDTVIRRLRDGYLAERDPYFSSFYAPFVPCDSTIGDPEFDIPVVYLGGQDCFWHTTADTLDKIDPEATARVAVLAASYAYFLASATSPEAEWLAEETCADGRSELMASAAGFAEELRNAELKELGEILGRAEEVLLHGRDVVSQRVRNAQKFATRSERREFRAAVRPMVSLVKKTVKEQLAYLNKLAARLADDAGQDAPLAAAPQRPSWWSQAEKITPVRLLAGTFTLDEVPLAEREGFPSPRWITVIACIFFRCDGQTTLAEACRLGLLDDGMDPASLGMDMVKFCKMLEKHGLLKLR
jgi:Peptidase family M28